MSKVKYSVRIMSKFLTTSMMVYSLLRSKVENWFSQISKLRGLISSWTKRSIIEIMTKTSVINKLSNLLKLTVQILEPPKTPPKL